MTPGEPRRLTTSGAWWSKGVEVAVVVVAVVTVVVLLGRKKLGGVERNKMNKKAR